MLQRDASCDEDQQRILRDDEMFKRLLIEQMKSAGISDPIKPIKAKGVIGEEILDRYVSGFISSLTFGNDSRSLPGVVSVIGAILSQEVIKGVTSIYAPISQWQFFEAFDSITSTSMASSPSDATPVEIDPDPSIVSTRELMNELKNLKVFVVGAGAIGCELLKNFALLGIGESTSMASRHQTSHKDSHQTSAGGDRDGFIVVTDMDLIEKSNLNRQLLFRYVHCIGSSLSLAHAFAL
jgi:hypothetical protein